MITDNASQSDQVDRTLNVLFLSHDSGMAGAQTVLGTLLNGLDRTRFLPHLVVPEEGPLSALARNAAIPVTRRHLIHWIPCRSDLRAQHRWSYAYQALVSLRTRAWAVTQLIARNGIDLVYSNTVTCLEGALAARMAGKPHIWHIHEPIANNSELLPLLPEWAYVRLIKLLSSLVIFPSHALAHDYPGLREVCAVIYNGLQLPKLQDRDACRAEVAAKLDIDASKHWVAVIGALQPRKDHRTFLAAAAAAARENDNIVFLIVGSGNENYTRALQTQIQTMGLASRVILTGRWEGEIATMLAAIDILAISSEQESFGLTAIEAMAVETPVVATRCGGPEEIVDDGENGTLVAVRDSDGMAKAILDLLGDPSKRRAFGSAGRTKANLRFTESQFVQGVQDSIVRIVDKSRTALHRPHSIITSPVSKNQ